jgi:DnaJ-class molecular chaperone
MSKQKHRADSLRTSARNYLWERREAELDATTTKVPCPLCEGGKFHWEDGCSMCGGRGYSRRPVSVAIEEGKG